MLSAPFGKREVFYEEWSKGEGWERYEIPATKCPRISAEFLKEEKKKWARFSAERLSTRPSRTRYSHCGKTSTRAE
jgi:hypothetical protein